MVALSPRNHSLKPFLEALLWVITSLSLLMELAQPDNLVQQPVLPDTTVLMVP